MGAVEIKQVAVKSVDSSVANLRAAKEVCAMHSVTVGYACQSPHVCSCKHLGARCPWVAHPSCSVHVFIQPYLSSLSPCCYHRIFYADLDGSGLQPVLEVLNTAIRASLGDKANEMDPGLGPAVRAGLCCVFSSKHCIVSKLFLSCNTAVGPG